LHLSVRFARLALLCIAVLVVGVVLVSGVAGGPRTPAALPGLPPPFLGTAIAGEGELTAAVDAYGDVVDLRLGPAGKALIDNPSDRQAAGTVSERTGIVPRVSVGRGKPMALWEGESVHQHYLRGTNVVETTAFVKEARLIVRTAAAGDTLAMTLIARSSLQGGALPEVSIDVGDGVHCRQGQVGEVLGLLCRAGRALPTMREDAPREVFRECDRVTLAAVAAGRHWSRTSRDLGKGAPRWARALYRRSLLTVRALTSQKTGAVAAGARDGWAYVWPRDAATAALALQATGHGEEARAVVNFLTGIDLRAAARFDENGAPIPGRAAQGDALGWVAAAKRSVGGPELVEPFAWRDRADYQESSPGDFLGNALAAASIRTAEPISKPTTDPTQVLREFGTAKGLVRVAGDPGSGLDSAAGWAIRPFELSALCPAAERTLLRLAENGTPYGITPGEGWEGGEDPWTAPTAWSAWALAAAGKTGAALELMQDLRRASTHARDLPERVGAHTGIPTSTTPLLWSSAFAVLALRELWPEGTRQRWRELR
jgi:hypothetical protein